MNPFADLLDLIIHPMWFLTGTLRIWLVFGAFWAVIWAGRLIARMFGKVSVAKLLTDGESLQEQLARNRSRPAGEEG
jgi:hypothetical protein